MTSSVRRQMAEALKTHLLTISGIGSVAVGGRPDATLARSEYPALDLILRGEQNTFNPFGVIESQSEVLLVGRVHGLDWQGLEDLIKLCKDKLGTGGTYSGTVIDIKWFRMDTDEGAFEDSTFWLTLTAYYQTTYGDV